MYSPKHNIFFIHIPKCAGSSIDVALFRENGIEVPPSDKVKSHISKKDRNTFYFFGPNRDAHATPNQLKGQREFDNATYKFATIRNPWDRFVSEYHWRKRMVDKNLTKERLAQGFIDPSKEKLATPHFTPQWKFIYDNDKKTMMVDEYFKIESDMDRLLETLREKTGNPDFTIPSRNQSKRDKDYRSFFDENLIKKLTPVFKDDMELFGYEF